MRRTIRVRQLFGKYRIERQLGEGGFATVYRALDTIEGVRVALKIPHQRFVTEEILEDFRSEVRLAARLKHPNILPLKNAEFIDQHFVIAFPLGERTLADRLRSRIGLPTALDYAEQMLSAVAYAHEHRIIHCDIKPENLILFPGGELMLTDFGIAKVAMKTVRASGSGTVGYVAPEQAMGKPSFRSDLFSLGLILYRMLAGRLPEWPFDWPPPGYDRIRRRLSPELLRFLRRAIALDPKDRFQSADGMLTALLKIKPKALRHGSRRSQRSSNRQDPGRDWRIMQRRQFLRQFGSKLAAKHSCRKCGGPLSEPMGFCPWCGRRRAVHPEDTRFPQRCPRCNRGLKTDWRFCPWCFGPGFEVKTTREYPDARYTGKCRNPGCSRKALMPFMRYCPWCRRKVRQRWKIEGSKESCRKCGWGVAKSFWRHCPWCGAALGGKRGH